MKKNMQKGITLVALVVTIIILLILAGISISALTNQGLFKQAQNAKNLTEEKTIEESAILTNYLEQINAITDEKKCIPVTEIILDKTEIIISAGSTEVLTATVSPSNASNKNLIWKSSDESVAIVSEGIITAKTVGNTIITATAQDGSEVSASCNITVEIVVGSTVEIKTEYNPQNICWQVVSNDNTTVNLVAKDPIGNLTLIGTNSYGGDYWMGTATLISETSKYYIYTNNGEKCEGKPIDSNIWNLMPDSLKVGNYWTGISWTDDNGWSGNFRIQNGEWYFIK